MRGRVINIDSNIVSGYQALLSRSSGQRITARQTDRQQYRGANNHYIFTRKYITINQL